MVRMIPIRKFAYFGVRFPCPLCKAGGTEYVLDLKQDFPGTIKMTCCGKWIQVVAEVGCTDREDQLMPDVTAQ